MNFYNRPVWAEVNLGVLKENMRNIQQAAKGKRVISVVKANAYGHGMIPVAAAIKECEVRDFAVAILAEAMELRASDPESSIMILGYTPGEEAEPVVANELTVTVITQAEAFKFQEEAVRQDKKVKFAIPLDTGMSRIGFPCTADSVKLIAEIANRPNVVMEELFSHFSTADVEDKTYSHLQLERYLEMKKALEAAGVHFNHYHMANSAAITDLPEAHFDTVRPGIIQYGYSQSTLKSPPATVRPILSWRAKIAYVKTIPEGVPVSYGNTWVSSRESVIGTIPLGYADGFNRLLSNKGHVLVNGKSAPIRGRVCMDQFMIDLTDIPTAKAGDIVTLLGEDGPHSYWADDMGDEVGTISYEIVCDISARVPRKYID